MLTALLYATGILAAVTGAAAFHTYRLYFLAACCAALVVLCAHTAANL